MNSSIFRKVRAGAFALGLILIMGVVALVTCSKSTESYGGQPTGNVVMRSGCGGFEVAKPSGWASTDKTCLQWEYNGEGTLQLFHLNAGMNCCTDLVADIDLDGNTITIREDEAGEFCYCLCLYDVEYSITDLPPGSYAIVVEETYLPEGDDILTVTVDLAENPSGHHCVDRTGYPWEPPTGSMDPAGGGC